MKRFKIDLEDANSSVKHEVLNNYIEKLGKRDKTLATSIAKELGIKSGKQLRKLQLQSELKNSGLLQLMKIRTSTFAFTNRLVHNKKIRNEFYNKCA